MKTAIVLIAALAAPPAVAANYEQQSAALKQCYAEAASPPAASPPDIWQRDFNFHPNRSDDKALDDRLWHCMTDGGWLFCPNCQVFASSMGGECGYNKNGMDRPACWHRQRQEPASLTGRLVAYWRKWLDDEIHGKKTNDDPAFNPQFAVAPVCPTMGRCVPADWFKRVQVYPEHWLGEEQ